MTKVKQDTERLWVWTAVAARSKLILALHIGRRSSADAHHLLHQVWQRLAPDSMPIFTSDGLNQFCRPHQWLTIPIRGPSKRRHRTPVMAAKLARHRWLVRDLLL